MIIGRLYQTVLLIPFISINLLIVLFFFRYTLPIYFHYHYIIYSNTAFFSIITAHTLYYLKNYILSTTPSPRHSHVDNCVTIKEFNCLVMGKIIINRNITIVVIGDGVVDTLYFHIPPIIFLPRFSWYYFTLILF